jgi:chromosome partitioning protein
MVLQVGARGANPAHVVVIGNEKGGSGKSTTAMHVAVALMQAGLRVATIDLDSRQRTLTHYVERRRQWAESVPLDLKCPNHVCIAGGSTLRLDDNETIEFAAFFDAVATAEAEHDVIVIDTPGTDCYLMRLAHCMADTLVTPLNDSFLDLQVLGTLDPKTWAVTGESHYAELVRDARRQRRLVDGVRLDWVVVRNRMAGGDIGGGRFGEGLRELASRLGFRPADGLSELPVYRDLFPHGLTALDEVDAERSGGQPGPAHLIARHEVRALIDALKLPLNPRGAPQVAAPALSRSTEDEPIEMLEPVDSLRDSLT